MRKCVPSVIVALSLAITGSLSSVHAQSQTQLPTPAAGKVLFVKGDVTLQAADGSSRPARQGQVIAEGERLVTGPGALGQVKMNDGGLVSVRPASEITFEPKRPLLPRTLSLNEGNARVLNMSSGPGEDGAPGTYLLRTPGGDVELKQADAVAAVQKKASETLVKLTGGSALVRRESGSSEPLTKDRAFSVTPEKVARTELAPGLDVPNPAIGGRPAKSVSNNVAGSTAPGSATVPGRFSGPPPVVIAKTGPLGPRSVRRAAPTPTEVVIPPVVRAILNDRGPTVRIPPQGPGPVTVTAKQQTQARDVLRGLTVGSPSNAGKRFELKQPRQGRDFRFKPK